jgi:hypothetical protein
MLASNPLGSILTATGNGVRNVNLAQIIRNPGLGGSQTVDEILEGAARGEFVLISAGPDGIFFSAGDGPGSAATGMQVTDLSQPPNNHAKVVEEFDDVLHFGGG